MGYIKYILSKEKRQDRKLHRMYVWVWSKIHKISAWKTGVIIYDYKEEIKCYSGNFYAYGCENLKEDFKQINTDL